MTCRTFKSGDGSVIGFACSRGERARCSVPECGRSAEYLCDYPLKSGKTCSKKLCGWHGVTQSKGVEFCPAHASVGAKVDHVRAATQSRSHTCHWPGCGKEVPPARWGCQEHWYKLPKVIRDRIWTTYQVGQEETMRPSKEYLSAAKEAEAWIATNAPPPRKSAPLLKWAGGKGWLVPELMPRIAAYLNRTGGYYVEPFLGGAAMALSLAREKMALSDIVEPLIEFYTVIRDDPGGFAWNLSSVALLGVEEEDYYRVRDMRPEKPVQRAARLMYLNRLCFNGLYRENRAGGFNVPYGDGVYRKSVVGRSARDAIESLFPNREKIEHVGRALKGAELFACDFAEPIACAGPGDLVFCDPPYDGVFDRYSKDGFGKDDQERLAEALEAARGRGAAIAACNADTPDVRRWYGDWADIQVVKEQRRISNTAAEKRPRADCVLITAGLDV